MPEWVDCGDMSFSKIGGRWTPRGEFGALYLNATIRVAAAQARHQHEGRATFDVPTVTVVDVVDADPIRALRLRKSTSQSNGLLNVTRPLRASSRHTSIGRQTPSSSNSRPEATVIVPRAAIPGFESIQPRQLADLAPQRSGFSIWSETADTGVRIERLLQIAGGPALTTIAASLLGQTSTPAKAAAARKNGQNGGRPTKKSSTVSAKRKHRTPTPV
jgi:hypothetical protein